MTDKLRAAAAAGLEALINGKNVRAGEGGTKHQPTMEDAAIKQLRAALAEQRVEPVDDVWFEDRNGASRKSPKDCQRFGANGVPEAVWVNGNRYTRREWMSLTDEEIASLSDNVQFGSRMAKLARIIEAALKEKNA